MGPFTHEFYRDVRRRLSPDGVFAQFLLIHRITYPEFCTLLGTLQATFPHCSVWVTGPFVLVVATVPPFAIDYERFRQGLQQPKVKASLEPFALGDPAALLGNFVVDERGVENLTRGAPINTEDRPFVGLTQLRFGDTVPPTLRHVFGQLTPVSSVLKRLPAEPANARSLLSRLDRFSLSHHYTMWAEHAYGQRRLSEAIDYAQAALQTNQEEANARRLLASAQTELARLESRAREQVRSFPGQASGYEALAQVLAARGESLQATEALEKALALGLDTPALRGQLGDLYLSLGRADDAARHFRQALNHRPKSAALRVALANALQGQNRHEEAESLVLEALEREADNVAAHETLGLIYLNRGELDKAQVQFEAMLHTDPLLASPHLHLARVREQRKLYPQAIASYRMALGNDPYLLPAYLNLTKLLGMQKDFGAAQDWALRGLRLLPASGELWVVLGHALLGGGHLQEAEEAYGRALALQGDPLPAYTGLALVATARGDREAASYYWQEVLRRDPQSRSARESLRALDEGAAGREEAP